jgi:hypothetical protein
MTREPTNVHGCSLLRILAILGAMLTLAVGTPASAGLLSHSGTFEDRGSPTELEPDSISLFNDLASTEDIITVVLNLSTAATGTTFEPGTWLFSANPFDIAATGFTGEVVTATTLTLTFTDFNPGERFRLKIDIDDDTNVVEGASIAGSTVTATFGITGDVVAVMADDGGSAADWSATAVPEPSTASLLLLGLTAIAAQRRISK